MKYTVEGFSQERLVELGLHIDDALVLRWFIDFTNTDRMRTLNHSGDTWYWVKYKGLIEDLPILGTNRRTAERKLQNLVKAGVLLHYTHKVGGVFSYYRINEPVYTSLISNSNRLTNEYNHCTDQYEGFVQNSTKGSYRSVQTNNSSTTHSSTIDDSEEMSQALQLASLLLTESRKHDEKLHIGKDKQVIARWAQDIEKLIRIDSRDYSEIERVIQWVKTEGNFWLPNIMSGKKLRDKFPQLVMQAKNTDKTKTYEEF